MLTVLSNSNRRDYVAVLKSNRAVFAICEVTEDKVTLQGWVHRDTLTLRDFAIRYELRKVKA